MDKNDVYGRVIYINLEAVVRADDTGGARGARYLLFAFIILKTSKTFFLSRMKVSSFV